MQWRKSPERIAKVGVEGSNPFARSNFLEKTAEEQGAAGEAARPADHRPGACHIALNVTFCGPR